MSRYRAALQAGEESVCRPQESERSARLSSESRLAGRTVGGPSRTRRSGRTSRTIRGH